MKLRVLSIVIILFCLLAQSCKTGGSGTAKKEGYFIEGITQNFPIGTKVLLQKLDGNKPITIDTTSIKQDGTFVLNNKVDASGFGQITMGRVPVFLILDNYDIKVEVDMQNPRDARVSGATTINEQQKLVDIAKKGGINKNFVTSYIDTTASPLLAYMAMQLMPFDKAPEVYTQAHNRLKKEMPNDPVTNTLGAMINQNKQKAAAEKAASKVSGVGAVAPDIEFPSPDGTVYKLSDLKGKVVLLDFWASWCRPCRAENPHVVKVYEKYKKKGFEVFSVSLDRSADRWKKAIEQDKLTWPYHVSDLKQWQSAPARLYGVRSIPATFLIGPEGKIIAKNLRGNRLEAKLKEVLGA